MVNLDKRPSVLGPRRKPPVEPAAKPAYTPYDGAELRPFSGRSGALDAYALPSMRGGRTYPPSLYMTNHLGEES
jgi:hypothetical protein